MATTKKITHFNEASEKQMGYAASVQGGNILYLAGVIAADEAMNIVASGDMRAQVEKVYDTIRRVLARSGAAPQNIVNEVIYATDLSLLSLPGVLSIRSEFYSGLSTTASTAVQVSGLIHPEALVEIQVTAVL